MTGFSWVDAAAVAGPVRAAVAAMAAFVVEDLELPPVEILWYDGPAGVRGVYVRVAGAVEAVALCASLTPARAARTVAHELRHAWQSRQGVLSGLAGPDLERDARRYAAGAARRCMVAGSGAVTTATI